MLRCWLYCGKVLGVAEWAAVLFEMGQILGRGSKTRMEGLGSGSSPSSFDSTFKKEAAKEKLSLMSMLTSVTLGVGLALLCLNYYHASSCVANSPDEKEAYINAVGRRLQAVEGQISHNTALMNKLIASLQAHSVTLDAKDMSALTASAESEAVKIALELVAYPAPVMPDSVKYRYDSSSSSSSWEGERKWDDQLSSLGKDGEEKESTGSYSTKFDDLYSSSSFKTDPSLSSGDGKKAEEPKWETLTDSEASNLCTELKVKYNVIPAVSWGNLPYDLQQKWLHYSCDYHIT